MGAVTRASVRLVGVLLIAAFLHLGSWERVRHVASDPTASGVVLVAIAALVQVVALVCAVRIRSSLVAYAVGIGGSFLSAMLVFILGGGF